MEQTRQELNEIFNQACENGEVYTIRSIIKQYPGYIDLENSDGFGFKKACEKDYVNIIDYLINTKEVVQNISLDFQENAGFYIACDNNSLGIIKYYFEHKEYQTKKGLINTVFIKSCETNNIKMYQILKDFDLLKNINPEWNHWQGFKIDFLLLSFCSITWLDHFRHNDVLKEQAFPEYLIQEVIVLYVCPHDQ